MRSPFYHFFLSEIQDSWNEIAEADQIYYNGGPDTPAIGEVRMAINYFSGT
jgi:hypothetical protein